MKRSHAWVAVLCLGLQAPPRVSSAAVPNAKPDSVASAETERRLHESIERHLGRPYSWGATGLKSYDCSGFVWRVMQENGVLIKRTTARKLWFSLPKVPESERWRFGNLVFLDHLKHCGIVDTRETFYHAQTHRGTNLSQFDPLWRRKVYGVRAMPLPRSAARDTTRLRHP